MNLINQAKNLPLSPGVYIWLDNKNKPFYVGRATSLRRRVLQYFRKDIDARLGEMVGLARKIKFYETDTVLEAIILEANLIKKYWPKYNIVDKDNRSFIYIVIPKADFPKPIIARGRELEKFPHFEGRTFGPYQSYTIVSQVLKLVRRIFPYGLCKLNQEKPCFDYQIGRCPGVCVGGISKKDYQKNINNLMLFLKGEKKRLAKKLAKDNPRAARELRHIQDVTLISRDELGANPGKFNRVEGYDISHFAGKEAYGSMAVFTAGEPDKKEYRLFKIKSVENNDLHALKEMVERRWRHTEWPRPDIMLVDGGKPQVDFIAKFLAERKISLPLLGISKLNGDRLVFPAGVKPGWKQLAEAYKPVFLRVRDEAHRFANRGRKMSMKIR